MADMNSFSAGFSQVWSMLGTALIVGGVILGIIVLVAIGLGVWYFKKRYNLRVEIKIPRSNNQLVLGEWGKGFYSPKQGVCYIKRPGMWFSSYSMKPFDLKKYIQGTDLLTVIQIGPREFRPVLPKSWTEITEDVEYDEIDDKTREKTGKVITKKEKVCLMSIDVDLRDDKAWQDMWEESGENAYTIKKII